MWKIILSTLALIIATAASAENVSINLNALQKPSWSEQEKANVARVTDFVQNLMNHHNFDYILEHYNDSAYVQHNRNLPDKIAGLVGFMQAFIEDYPEYSYDVKHIYADGHYVIFHSHATLKASDRGDDSKGLNIIDTWRLENGQIVEHWDSIQALDGFMRFYSLISGGDIKNNNGVF